MNLELLRTLACVRTVVFKFSRAALYSFFRMLLKMTLSRIVLSSFSSYPIHDEIVINDNIYESGCSPFKAICLIRCSRLRVGPKFTVLCLRRDFAALNKRPRSEYPIIPLERKFFRTHLANPQLLDIVSISFIVFRLDRLRSSTLIMNPSMELKARLGLMISITRLSLYPLHSMKLMMFEEYKSSRTVVEIPDRNLMTIMICDWLYSMSVYTKN